MNKIATQQLESMIHTYTMTMVEGYKYVRSILVALLERRIFNLSQLETA